MAGVVALAGALTGCVAEPNERLMYWMRTGQYEQATAYMREHQTRKRSSRDYLLDRMRLGLAAMAAGDQRTADEAWEEVYELLRLQGVNADKTVPSVVLNEDVKFWKGEPFEQAMGFFYVAVHYAGMGSWDNARAAASNALFYLRDFGRDPAGGPMEAERLILKAQVEGGGYLEHGYVPTPSDFALGHLMMAMANVQLGRVEEAADHAHAAVKINPRLAALADHILSGKYNTVLVVDYGLGPQKIGTGPDNAVAKFMPLTPSGNQPLQVTAGAERWSFQPVADLNRMAADLKWNNLEDVRIAKSRIGSLLMMAGTAAVVIGSGAGSEEAVYGGLGGLGAGLFSKAGAHADTRYVEVLPQRVYVAPVQVPEGESVQVQILGLPQARAVVQPRPAADGSARLCYVRLGARPLVPVADRPPGVVAGIEGLSDSEETLMGSGKE